MCYPAPTTKLVVTGLADRAPISTVQHFGGSRPPILFSPLASLTTHKTILLFLELADIMRVTQIMASSSCKKNARKALRGSFLFADTPPDAL